MEEIKATFMHSVVMAEKQVPSLALSLGQKFSQVAFRGAGPWEEPPAPSMKSGVRKKRASRTDVKMHILLLTNSDLQALRVQNENMSERENPIFRSRAWSPACGGGVHEEEGSRAARRKFSF
jgi:hypothetical protein